MLKNKAVFLILLSFLLSACGTKGPLYIPEQRYPQAAQLSPAVNQNHAREQTMALQASIHAAFTQNNQLQLVYSAGTTLAVARASL
jgi:predicted small lipoprotein YifL